VARLACSFLHVHKDGKVAEEESSDDEDGSSHDDLSDIEEDDDDDDDDVDDGDGDGDGIEPALPAATYESPPKKRVKFADSVDVQEPPQVTVSVLCFRPVT